MTSQTFYEFATQGDTLAEQVFSALDKEGKLLTTDNNVKLVAKKGGQPLFGSLYVDKSQWPKGATGMTLAPTFTFEEEVETD